MGKYKCEGEFVIPERGKNRGKIVIEIGTIEGGVVEKEIPNFYVKHDDLKGKKCEIHLKCQNDFNDSSGRCIKVKKSLLKHSKVVKVTGDGKELPKRIMVPLDTIEILNSISLKDIENLHLRLNKCVLFEEDDGGKLEVLKDFDVLPLDMPSSLSSIMQTIESRNNVIEDSFRRLGYVVETFTASVQWRLAVGLGCPSVYENNITLHHIYGIPYIPASSIKGIARSFMILKDFNGDEKVALQDKNFCDIFGSTSNSIYKESRRGSVIFFDAFPTSHKEATEGMKNTEKTKDIGDIIEYDVMTPHYYKYYNGEAPPADYYSPKIIPFLVVKKGVPFKFTLMARAKNSDNLKQVRDKLKEALLNHGMGAKTSVGYGYFNAIK